MPALIALVNYVVSILLSLVGITQTRADQLTVNAIQAALTDPVVGLVAIHNELATVISDLATLEGDVLAIQHNDGAQQAINLPTTPPTGYGGASAGDVWGYTPPSQVHTTGELVVLAGWFPIRLNEAGIALPLGEFPYLAMERTWDEPTFGAPNFYNLDTIDPSTILATDSSTVGWLTRQYPSSPWFDVGNGMVTAPDGTGQYTAAVTITPAQFLLLQAWAVNGSLGGKPPVLAPIWPGLANVTYGDPESMDPPNGSLSGPADGYKIEIDAVPSWAGKFDFGDVVAWRNCGAITFVDDEGVPEFAQTIGLANVIYLPQSMQHSVGAYYRLAIGFHASATPFTINT